MSELVQKCGGQIVTDGQIKNAVQSHLSVKVPLHISYVYHSSNEEDGWTDFNHHSFFRLTAVYDTGVLWKNGVGLPEKADLKGNMHLTSIIIRKKDMRLQVSFRTKALFRGQFILSTRGMELNFVGLYCMWTKFLSVHSIHSHMYHKVLSNNWFP